MGESMRVRDADARPGVGRVSLVRAAVGTTPVARQVATFTCTVADHAAPIRSSHFASTPVGILQRVAFGTGPFVFHNLIDRRQIIRSGFIFGKATPQACPVSQVFGSHVIALGSPRVRL